jgi:hypothetical protein
MLMAHVCFVKPAGLFVMVLSCVATVRKEISLQRR